MCKSKVPEERFGVVRVELSCSVLLEPLCSCGRRGKLSWPERERCALSAGLRVGDSCPGEWEVVWTKDRKMIQRDRGPGRGWRPGYFSGTRPRGVIFSRNTELPVHA